MRETDKRLRVRGRTAVAAVVTLLTAATTGAGDGAGLRVHLPRQINVRSETLTLGSIALCRSEDADLAARAERITMGRAPFSGESLTVKRSTIVSRLGSSGIDTDLVRMTGAEAVTVLRDEQIISADRIQTRAEELLQQEQPGPEGCVFQLTRRPDDMPISATEDFELVARILDNMGGDMIRVEVAAVSGQDTLGATELSYRVAYPWREAVAAADLPAGTVLTEENITVRNRSSHRPQENNWSPPVGRITTRPVSAGTVLRDNMLRSSQPETVVKRNETVVMSIDGGGFTLRWLGRALQDGRPGEIIRVRNVDSNRVVSARVAYDGTVTPVYEGTDQ